MLRREWTFEKPVGELIVAAEQRYAHHSRRIDFWVEEREKVNASIGESGIQIRKYPVTGGDRHDLVIDPTLMKRLSECEEKIAEHQRKADDYSQWHAAFKAADGRSFTLDHDDWLFFFGLRGDDDE